MLLGAAALGVEIERKGLQRNADGLLARDQPLARLRARRRAAPRDHVRAARARAEGLVQPRGREGCEGLTRARTLGRDGALLGARRSEHADQVREGDRLDALALPGHPHVHARVHAAAAREGRARAGGLALLVVFAGDSAHQVVAEVAHDAKDFLEAFAQFGGRPALELLRGLEQHLKQRLLRVRRLLLGEADRSRRLAEQPLRLLDWTAHAVARREAGRRVLGRLVAKLVEGAPPAHECPLLGFVSRPVGAAAHDGLEQLARPLERLLGLAEGVRAPEQLGDEPLELAQHRTHQAAPVVRAARRAPTPRARAARVGGGARLPAHAHALGARRRVTSDVDQALVAHAVGGADRMIGLGLLRAIPRAEDGQVGLAFRPLRARARDAQAQATVGVVLELKHRREQRQPAMAQEHVGLVGLGGRGGLGRAPRRRCRRRGGRGSGGGGGGGKGGGGGGGVGGVGHGGGGRGRRRCILRGHGERRERAAAAVIPGVVVVLNLRGAEGRSAAVDGAAAEQLERRSQVVDEQLLVQRQLEQLAAELAGARRGVDARLAQQVHAERARAWLEGLVARGREQLGRRREREDRALVLLSLRALGDGARLAADACEHEPHELLVVPDEPLGRALRGLEAQPALLVLR